MLMRPRLGSLLAVFAASVFAADDRPSVVFIFADDQQADTIRALGNPHIRTPNLDRLAARGVAFDRAYMQGGLNAATCVPSRAMLLSARPLFHIDEKLTRDETWPAAFGRAGYTTFTLHFYHFRNISPDIFYSFRSPFICQFGHGGRGCDGIDGTNFVNAVSHISRSFITING